jgi:hypothetical protein
MDAFQRLPGPQGTPPQQFSVRKPITPFMAAMSAE